MSLTNLGLFIKKTTCSLLRNLYGENLQGKLGFRHCKRLLKRLRSVGILCPKAVWAPVQARVLKEENRWRRFFLTRNKEHKTMNKGTTRRKRRVLFKKSRGCADPKAVRVSQAQAVTKFPQQKITRESRCSRDRRFLIMMKWWLV